LSENPIRKTSVSATIQAICEKPDAVKILHCLDRLGEPVKPSQIEKISGVDYDKIVVIGNRLVDMGVLQLDRQDFDKRVIRYSILNEEVVKQVFDYYDKQTAKRKAELGTEGVEEV